MLSLTLVLIGAALASSAEANTGRSLMITTSLPLDAPSCLQNAYYGAFGGGLSQDHIWIPTTSCTSEYASLGSEEIIDVIEEVLKGGRYVWVGPSGVDHGLSGHPEMGMEEVISYIYERQDLALARGEGLHGVPGSQSQLPWKLSGDDEDTGMWGLIVLYASDTSLVLYVAETFLGILDTVLPPHLVPVALPVAPITAAISADASASANAKPLPWDPVPQHYADHLSNVTKHLSFDPALDEILDSLDANSIRRNVRYLTGEGPSGIESRHSFTKGAREAAAWIKEKVEDTGAKCHYHSYLPGFSPNVICEYPHDKGATGKVILSAHYDSRGSFGSTRAPGGDDDGSGSAHLLEVAAAVGRWDVRFRQPVVFAWFSGEEQGLFGSQYYAASLQKDNESVILNVQGDMLGYRAPGEPLQMALPISIHTPEASYLLGNLSTLYAPELVVGVTPGCCSDHQSFHAIGYPATAVFERNGPIADPMYHNSGDLSAREGYDFEQIRAIAKVTMAAVLTMAGWRVD